MTALTDTQLAYLRSEVSGVSEDRFQEAYDELGSLAGAAALFVNARLAELEADASSYTIPGVISESYDATIRSLTERSKRLQAVLEQEALATVQEDGAGGGRLLRPDRVR